MSAKDILAYRLRQQGMRKGKQLVRGSLQRDATSGSGTLPLAMFSALELDSGSSHSPAEASEHAGCTASHTSARGAEIPLVPFYIEVPALPKTISRTAATAAHASPTAVPATTTAPVPDAPAPAAPSPTAATAAPAPAPIAASTPTPIPTPVATPAPVTTPSPTTSPVATAPANPASAPTLAPKSAPPAAASPQSTTDSPASGPGSSPCAGSPALAPALRRFLAPEWHQVHGPMSPSRRQQSNADATQGRSPGGDLADRIQALERRMEEFDEWRRRDEEWKRQVEERLRKLA